MSSRVSMRPGPVAGRYPERVDERVTSLDRALAKILGAFSRATAGISTGGGAFVRRVNRRAGVLDRMSDMELVAEREAVVEGLALSGLTDSGLVRAFALVRELSHRTIGLRHFDVQLLGGRSILRGEVAEMETGEGKTLTATLSASVMALAGVPVHVITVNDFLAARDARLNAPLFRALGLSVGVIQEESTTEQRRTAYACDITYCTNKQIVFDYLKDRLALEGETRAIHLALNGILKRKVANDKPIMMRGLCFAIVDEADSVLIDEARTPLIITRPGRATETEQTYQRAISLARDLHPRRDFVVQQQNWKVELTDLGRAQLSRLTRHFGSVWAVANHREDLVSQALAALHLYQKDKHYIVDETGVRIVDEYTGRVMADRSWERGLHQMIEVKEGVDISSRQETLIRISYQKYFRRYIGIGGMTGTAREVASELRSVYRLRTRRIPTNRKSLRRDLGERCFVRESAKWAAVVEEIRVVHGRGQPVLVGTQSVAASEHLSHLLSEAGLPHKVLNARQNAEEAEVIERAGQADQITVATNMAGRGADIPLGGNVRELGGLHVIATGRHDARRIDRQLYGRCARQGDPGTHRTFVSLEDDLMTSVYGYRLAGILARVFPRRMPRLVAIPLVRFAQKSLERRNGRLRTQLLHADDSLEDLLAFSGRAE